MRSNIYRQRFAHSCQCTPRKLFTERRCALQVGSGCLGTIRCLSLRQSRVSVTFFTVKTFRTDCRLQASRSLTPLSDRTGRLCAPLGFSAQQARRNTLLVVQVQTTAARIENFHRLTPLPRGVRRFEEAKSPARALHNFWRLLFVVLHSVPAILVRWLNRRQSRSISLATRHHQHRSNQTHFHP